MRNVFCNIVNALKEFLVVCCIMICISVVLLCIDRAVHSKSGESEASSQGEEEQPA